MGVSMFQKIRESRKILSAIFACLFLFPLLGQALDLAGYSFAYAPAKPLNNPVHLSKGLKSFGFVSGVGGVAFGGIAKPQGDLKVVNLNYDGTKPDGERLIATIKDGNGSAQTVTAPVADWILVPIARFAQGNQHAIFTLFGQLQNGEEEKKWLTKKARILNYHPAVANSLAGMRLFQADLLAFHDASSDIPSSNGKFLLGTGEHEPNVGANTAARKIIREAYNLGQPQSYVICDEGQSITFSVASSTQGDRQLLLDGFPYWASWKLSKDMKDLPIEFVKKYFAAHEEEMKATILTKAAQKGVQDREALLPIIREVQEIFAKKAVKDKNEFNRFVDDNNYLVNMDEFSREFSDKMRQLKGGNPIVYDALTTSMRYAAFFRYFKAQDPKQYAKFVKSLANVAINPAIKTPTVLIPPARSEQE